MPTEITLSRLRQYQAMRDRLIEAREREFAPGRAVRVINERYHGHGLIVRDDGCPVDQLAVKLENGNTWWYPIEDCSIEIRDRCPQWLLKLIDVQSKSVIKRLRAQKSGATLG